MAEIKPPFCLCFLWQVLVVHARQLETVACSRSFIAANATTAVQELELNVHGAPLLQTMIMINCTDGAEGENVSIYLLIASLLYDVKNSPKLILSFLFSFNSAVRPIRISTSITRKFLIFLNFFFIFFIAHFACKPKC